MDGSPPPCGEEGSSAWRDPGVVRLYRLLDAMRKPPLHGWTTVQCGEGTSSPGWDPHASAVGKAPLQGGTMGVVRLYRVLNAVGKPPLHGWTTVQCGEVASSPGRDHHASAVRKAPLQGGTTRILRGYRFLDAMGKHSHRTCVDPRRVEGTSSPWVDHHPSAPRDWSHLRTSSIKTAAPAAVFSTATVRERLCARDLAASIPWGS
jgi:hypothetical protein